MNRMRPRIRREIIKEQLGFKDEKGATNVIFLYKDVVRNTYIYDLLIAKKFIEKKKCRTRRENIYTGNKKQQYKLEGNV